MDRRPFFILPLAAVCLLAPIPSATGQDAPRPRRGGDGEDGDHPSVSRGRSGL